MSRAPCNRQHFYKYTTPTTAVSVMTTSKLRWGSADYFNRINDAFDVPRRIDFGFTELELLQEYVRQLAYVIETGAVDRPSAHEQSRAFFAQARQVAASTGKSFPEIAAAIRLHFENFTLVNGPSFSHFQNLWDDMRPQIRMFCASAVPDLPKMWVHYAAGHSGVVLEFSPTPDTDSVFALMRDIEYTDAPPRLFSKEQSARDILGIEKLDFREFFTEHHYLKTPDWSDERECRLVNYDYEGGPADFTDYEFNPQDLRKIILGPYCESSAEQALRMLAAKEPWKHVTFHRASHDHGRRKVIFGDPC
jgi:hypothetical protein